MTGSGEWIHIADHAWELHGQGAQYTVHQENRQWIARKFSLDRSGAATKETEEHAESLEEAKQAVERWQSNN